MFQSCCGACRKLPSIASMAMLHSSAARPTLAAALVSLLVLTCLLGNVEAVHDGLSVDLASYSLSLGSTDKLEVVLTSHDGSPAPPATVTLISAHSVASDSAPIFTKQKFESLGDGKYQYDFLSSKVSPGKYKLKIEAKYDATLLSSTKDLLTTVVAVTVPISVSNVQLSVLESDADLSESGSTLDYSKKETAILSATHLQKLKLALELTTPSGSAFKPQQVFLKLRHETGGEHLYLIKPSGKRYEYTLDFSTMVEKLNHLSGTYTIELIVGDDVMENPFMWTLASLDLDLPEGPGGTAAAELPSEPTSKFSPKPEISHIFRQPEKRPPKYLSATFLLLTLIPFIGFLVGLQQCGVNLKSLPSGGLPLAAAIGFHGGIASILVLYLMFWLKLNLFTTLQWLGFLGLFTLVPGFQILSYLADHSSKLKVS